MAELEPDQPVPVRPSGEGGLYVHNTVCGAVQGMVQVGVVHGGVHLHEAPASAEPVVPRQLPAAPAQFAGRAAELTELDRALASAPTGSRDAVARGRAAIDVASSIDAGVVAAGVVVSAIGGAGGIGKTWLVLAWAHRNLERFPDGQLFVDLHGFSPMREPLEPGVAVRGFLDALGVDAGAIPADLEAQAALYRSLVADRRMLVVLDNAATADQVIPLLPGGSTCTVLITSRRTLASLIDRHGAQHLPLGVLTHDEARALLAARLGADRVTAEPGAVDELFDLCGGYPLALAITARNAASHPGTSLTEAAAELRELGLEMLDHDSDSAASLSAVLSWSLRHLTDEQRTLFGLLGIAPGSDTTLPAVVALTALPPSRARRALSALVEASLVERRPRGRYAMHDLVRHYAATRAAAPDDVREAAVARVVDFHLHTAHTADRLVNPHRECLHPGPLAPDVHPHPLLDVSAAMDWLEAEHGTLLATQRAAVDLGRHDVVWHLAWVLDVFHVRRGHRHDALASWRAALDAAAHLPDPAARSRAHRNLGRSYSRLGLYDDATDHLDQALALAGHHGDLIQQAHTHRALALTWERRGDDQRALEHAQHALDLHRMLNQPAWEAEALNAVGWYAGRLGVLDTAREHCLAALALHQHHRYPEGEAATLDSLGFIAHRAGDHRQAVEHYRQALALYRTLGHRYQSAGTLDSIGRSHAALGQLQQARAAWQEALALYREQGRESDTSRVQQQLHAVAGVAG
ncbi:ATP-binding protein [Actinokineospora sp. NPDC004072]